MLNIPLCLIRLSEKLHDMMQTNATYYEIEKELKYD